MEYTSKNIKFNSVKLPQTLIKEGPIGVVPTYEGENSEGNKGIIYNNSTIINVKPFINAVDIDWNGAEIDDKTSIDTTPEFLKWVKDSVSGLDSRISEVENMEVKDGADGKSAYEIYLENGGDIESELEWLDSLKGVDGVSVNQFEIGTVETVNSNVAADVTITTEQDTVKLNFKIPKGEKGDTGSVDIGEDDSIDLSNYVTNDSLSTKLSKFKTDELDPIFEGKQDNLVSGENIRYIEVSLKNNANKKYISLLKEDNTTYDTSDHSSGSKIYMAEVAFTGNYNDLKNTPTDDKYVKIFRKSQREEATLNYPDKDSILRVVYECVSKGSQSVIAGEQYGLTSYTAEEAAAHNQTLTGAVSAGDILTSSSTPSISLFNETFKSIYEDLNYPPFETGHVVTTTEANSYNSSLPEAVHEGGKKSGSVKENIHGESLWILNLVKGNHSVALGWGTVIDGNHSFTEGKFTQVPGDFSHASGYLTKVNGNYSYSGGIKLNDGLITGNYSFGYGKDLITNNNGEVAFGQYNKSTTIEELQYPVKDEIAIDNEGNQWKIVDFYNITLSNFEDNINLDFGDFLSNKEDYNFGYEALTVNGNNVTYDDGYSWSFDGNNLSSNYTTFIHQIFKLQCLKVENIGSIYEFLTKNIFDLNYYKSLYTYKYRVLAYAPGGIDASGCIVGVIAKKVGENVHDFFVWGPNSLYYDNNPITMFSLGNGNEMQRSNLFEITSDGNVYYANRTKNLFQLEERIESLENNQDLSVVSIANLSGVTRSGTLVSFSLGINSPSKILFNDYTKSEDNSDNTTCNISIENSSIDFKKCIVVYSDFNLNGTNNFKIVLTPPTSKNIYFPAVGNYFEITEDKEISFDNVNNYIFIVIIEKIGEDYFVDIKEYDKGE